MVSTYGYITVAELEEYVTLDYSAVDAKYTDAIIEAKISQAERLINEHAGSSTAALTVTDGVKAATLIIAQKLMNIQRMEDGYREKELPLNEEFIDITINMCIKSSDQIGVVSIPMSGADRY